MPHRTNDHDGRRRAILIAGPTASGKSALAMEIARRSGGVIVNADAMQVYAELRIVTARPSAADECIAEHRLFGHVPARERYSAGAWLADATTVIDEAWSDARLVIIVGGTGLYFKSLEEGLSAIPPVPASVREQVRAESEASDAPALHAALARCDPDTASLVRPSDRQRIVRALEVLRTTGRPLSSWQTEARAGAVLGGVRTARLFLAPERPVIYAAINHRLARMVREGALEEVEILLRQKLDASLPAMKAIGVSELASHLSGAVSLEEAIENASARSRRYAKRQLTWFRHQMSGWPTASPAETAPAAQALLEQLAAG